MLDLKVPGVQDHQLWRRGHHRPSPVHNDVNLPGGCVVYSSTLDEAQVDSQMNTASISPRSSPPGVRIEATLSHTGIMESSPGFLALRLAVERRDALLSVLRFKLPNAACSSHTQWEAARSEHGKK